MDVSDFQPTTMKLEDLLECFDSDEEFLQFMRHVASNQSSDRMSATDIAQWAREIVEHKPDLSFFCYRMADVSSSTGLDHFLVDFGLSNFIAIDPTELYNAEGVTLCFVVMCSSHGNTVCCS